MNLTSLPEFLSPFKCQIKLSHNLIVQCYFMAQCLLKLYHNYWLPQYTRYYISSLKWRIVTSSIFHCTLLDYRLVSFIRSQLTRCLLSFKSLPNSLKLLSFLRCLRHGLVCYLGTWVLLELKYSSTCFTPLYEIHLKMKKVVLSTTPLPTCLEFSLDI